MNVAFDGDLTHNIQSNDTSFLDEIKDCTVSPRRNETHGGSSWYLSVFLVVNAALGAGLLNFPAAYHQSGGLPVAISIQAVLVFFVTGSLLILAYCSDINGSATYQDVVLHMCGIRAYQLCIVGVILYCFGTCVTFFIIIADQWDKLLLFARGPDFCDYWYLRRSFTMPVSCVVLVLPLCFSKRIDFLKYASTLGVLSILYCVLLVTVKYFVGENHPGPIRTRPQNWTDVFLVVPVICFGYQCHLSVVPIYSCLRTRTLANFSRTLLVAMVICLLVYTGTASFGYLSFGANVNEDVLLSYAPTPDVLAAVGLVALKMYTTYPILLFVGRMAIESLLESLPSTSSCCPAKTTQRPLTTSQQSLTSQIEEFGDTSSDVVFAVPRDNENNRAELLRRAAVVLVWFGSSLLLAVLLPDIGGVIALLGGLAALFVFTFPGLCLLQVVLSDHTTAHGNNDNHPSHGRSRPLQYALLSCCVFYIVVGVFIFGLVTTRALMADVVEFEESMATHAAHHRPCR